MKALVTVELQLCGDLFLSFGCSYGRKYEIDILFSTRLVSNNTVVIEVANNRKVQYALSRLDVRYICYPFLIRALGVKISVEQIGVSMQMFTIIALFFATNDRKQIVFLHNSKNGLRILMDSLSFKPYMHSTVAVGAMAMLLTFPNLLGKWQIPRRNPHSLDIVIVATS